MSTMDKSQFPVLIKTNVYNPQITMSTKERFCVPQISYTSEKQYIVLPLSVSQLFIFKNPATLYDLCNWKI